MESKAFKVFLHILFVLISFVMVYPFWYTLICSLSPYNEIMLKTMPLLPTRLDFSAYKEIIDSGILTNAFKVTIFETVVGVTLSMIFTIGGAYVLSLDKLPGQKIISTTILITMFFSGGLLPLYILLAKIKLTNSIWVYIFPGLINTMYMFIIRSAFQDIPKELREAAEIDGASEIKILLKIYLPICKTTLLVIGLFYLVDKWNDLYTSLYFVVDYKKFTLQAALYNLFNSNSSSGIGTGSIKTVDEQVKYAAIIVTILPMIVIYPFLQKYFTKGVLLGSVKE